jgi:hypothetical protein
MAPWRRITEPAGTAGDDRRRVLNAHELSFLDDDLGGSRVSTTSIDE